MRLHCLTGVFFCCVLFAATAQDVGVANVEKIRIACVGNSITYGGGLKDKATEPYPAVLQSKLGDRYEVGNFGKNGATLVAGAPNAYVATEEYKKALAFRPHIVIIDLGINDTGLAVWPSYRDDFTSDYLSLIHSFRALDPQPEIWICTLTPYFNQSRRFKAALRDWYWEIQDNIRIVAREASTGVIDLHSPLYSMPHLFSDAVHPDKDGARIMGETIYSYISGVYGGLSVAPVFGSHMVLQRNKPIPVWGKADRGQEVSVTLGDITMKTTPEANGSWKVVFPPRKEGGPLKLRIATSRQVIVLEDILVGEVWICSGQSNMTFKLSEAATADVDIPLAQFSEIRFFNMRTADPSIRNAWDPELLQRINGLDYEGGVWEVCTPETAARFSAVAYYFGKGLHLELDVPVGLVHNSKGGSPAEAWIDRRTLEFDPVLADLLHDWKNNPLIGRWCRETAIRNTENASNPLQRHPYEPAYLFEACMSPWVGFPLRGAIWYQGEANTHNVELHERLFTKLTESWRSHWGDDFPIYFAQLSSFQGLSWPRFRDSQRLLAGRIPRTGMAVTADLGDSLDIHPKRKKEVGERLALLALGAEYGYKKEYSGPVFTRATLSNGNVRVQFTHASGLRTSDRSSVRSFELAGEDKVFRNADARIEKNGIVVQSPDVPSPRYVRYGWQPFSRANLVNADGLPASTFLSGVESRYAK